MTTDDEQAPPRTYDHLPLAGLPEYQAARKAVNDLVNAINRDGLDMSQAGFSRTVDDMARTSYAADGCECCQGPVWPHAADVDPDPNTRRMVCTYRCPRTGRSWTCHWTTDPNLLEMMP